MVQLVQRWTHRKYNNLNPLDGLKKPCLGSDGFIVINLDFHTRLESCAVVIANID